MSVDEQPPASTPLSLSGPSPHGGSGRWRAAALIAASLVAVGFVGVLAAVMSRGIDPHRVPFMLEGKPAPAFTLKRLDNGEPVSLAQFSGKPVVLNFWSSWCGPCKQEHPVIEWANNKFGKEVQFLGVVFEDSEENARSALGRFGINFPQLVDPGSSMAVDYGVTGVPETYFIDRAGIIRHKVAAPVDPELMVTRLSELTGARAER